jgi:acyl-coenzyme A thioesterase PaaI-like protein
LCAATLDMRFDYLRPAAPARLSAWRGFVRSLARDGDASEPVAHVTGTFMFTDEAPRSGG